MRQQLPSRFRRMLKRKRRFYGDYDDDDEDDIDEGWDSVGPEKESAQ
jgi:hypothetical protein